MVQRPSPTIRRRRLGAELRRHRERAGVTIDVVAERLGFSPSKVSRIETGHTGATPRDVRAMLVIYDVDRESTDELVQIAREARQKGWWHPYSPILTGAYIGLETAARSIRTYEQQVVPGLLQTEQYAIAMIRAARVDDTDPQTEQRVRLRMTRQSLLIQDDPIDLEVVLDEAVVSRPVGGDEVMSGQLKRLAEACESPNITLRILPFAAGVHAGMEGSFSILEFPDAEDPDVVFAENALGGLLLDKADDLRKYHSIFERIRSSALTPEESRTMIAMLKEEPLWKLRPRVSGST